MDSTTHADAQLVRQVWDCDNNAFEKLAVKYQNPLYSLIRGWLDNPEDVLDCAQETFLKAYKVMKESRKPDDPSKFWPYLRQIAHNVAMDMHRPYQNLDKLKDFISIDETTSSHELRILLQEMIDKLPGEERIVILIYYFEGLKEEEIAKILGRSQTWVNLKKRDGLKKLRKMWKEGS